MQIFANRKRRFYSFIEFCVINLKNQGLKIWSYYHLTPSEVWHLHPITAGNSRFIKPCTASWLRCRTASFLTCSELLSFLIRQVAIVKKLLPFCTSWRSPGSSTLHSNQLMLCTITILFYCAEGELLFLPTTGWPLYSFICKLYTPWTVSNAICSSIKKHISFQIQD